MRKRINKFKKVHRNTRTHTSIKYKLSTADSGLYNTTIELF